MSVFSNDTCYWKHAIFLLSANQQNMPANDRQICLRSEIEILQKILSKYLWHRKRTAQASEKYCWRLQRKTGMILPRGVENRCCHSNCLFVSSKLRSHWGPTNCSCQTLWENGPFLALYQIFCIQIEILIAGEVYKRANAVHGEWFKSRCQITDLSDWLSSVEKITWSSLLFWRYFIIWSLVISSLWSKEGLIVHLCFV